MERKVTQQILFRRDPERYRSLKKETDQFIELYCKDPAIKDGIFTVIENYTRKNNIKTEILRYPFHDDDLWAIAFIKGDTVFICINTGLALCQQLFAAAHELYHVKCYIEETATDTLRNGSLLKREIVDEISGDQEELEANAFASMLLMPERAVEEQMKLQGIDSKKITMENILMMMDTFAIPYHACVLRMYECGYTVEDETLKLYEAEESTVSEAISRYGRARLWNRNGDGTESFGSLFEAFRNNVENEYLTPMREMEDGEYIKELKKKLLIDQEAHV